MKGFLAHRWLAIPQFALLLGIGIVLGVILTTQQKVLISVIDIEETLTRATVEAAPRLLRSMERSHSSDGSTSSDTGVRVAWLQSFPNSGTSYTLRMVQRLSNTRTALNYGIEEKGKLEPVLADQPEGPFWTHFDDDFNPNYTKPVKFALTKTHCGGRCVSCYPTYYLQTMQSFRDSCLATSWHSADGKERKQKDGTYRIEDVGKAVHMFRNPFDNVVSRYHNYRFNENIPGPGSRKDFRSYCAAVNNKTIATERKFSLWSKDLMEIMEPVPCKSDFFKYVQWHNLAFATTSDNEIETMPLYYEDFETNLNSTVNRLFEFIELEQKGAILPFSHGKSYLDHFTDDEIDRIRRGIRIMSTRKTWGHIRHYFKNTTAVADA